MPGIPGDPRVFTRASKAAIRRCNSAMVAFCSAMIASRVSRLAVVRSSLVSTLLVYHDCPNTASILRAPLDQIYLIKPEQLLIDLRDIEVYTPSVYWPYTGANQALNGMSISNETPKAGVLSNVLSGDILPIY